MCLSLSTYSFSVILAPEKTKEYYHFTDKKGAVGIEKSGKIKESEAGGPDSTFGKAVYVTSMKPNEHSVENIANNNWDDARLPQQKIKEGKMDVAIKLELPDSAVSKADTKRNVFCHRGDVPTSRVKEVWVKDKSGNYKQIKKQK